MVGRSPLCLNIQSSSVSFDRCCHSLLIHVFVALLKSRLMCIVLSVTSRFVNLLPDRSDWRHQRLEVRKSSNHRVDTLAHIYTCNSLAVAQPHEHSEHRLLQRPIKIHREEMQPLQPIFVAFRDVSLQPAKEEAECSATVWSVEVAVDLVKKR